MSGHPLPLSLFCSDPISVSAGTGDWHGAARERALLVTSLEGSGVVTGFGAAVDWYGLWFGFEVDGTFVAIHNGGCLYAMRLIGAAANGAAAWCPHFTDPHDLSIAWRGRLTFDREFKLFLGNSDAVERRATSVHVYLDGRPEALVPKGRLLPSWEIK